MRTLARAYLLLVALLVTGCAAGELPYPPTLNVPLSENDHGTFALLVYDESGLLVSAESGPPGAGGATPAEVTATPARNEIVVNWLGGACSHQPWLRIKGDATNLDLVIAPTPVELSLTPAVQCPAVGIPSSARITLDQPVEQEDVSISEIR